MFSKVEELMFCREPWQMLLLLENVLLGFQIFLQKDKLYTNMILDILGFNLA